MTPVKERQIVNQALGIILPKGKKDMSCYEPGIVGEGVQTKRKIGKSGFYAIAELQFYEDIVTFRLDLGVPHEDGFVEPIMTLHRNSVPYDYFFEEHPSPARLFRHGVRRSILDFSKHFEGFAESIHRLKNEK